MNSLLFIRVQPYSLSSHPHMYLPLLSPFAGDIGTLALPEGMQELSLNECTGLTGDIGTLVLPESIPHLRLSGCYGLTGKAKG